MTKPISATYAPNPQPRVRVKGHCGSCNQGFVSPEMCRCTCHEGKS